MESDQLGNYICRFCRGSFTQAQHLYKHVQQIHAASPSTKNSRTCPICGTVFGKYEGYRTHLRHIHGQRNEGQIFAFKCFNDFYSWKNELERRSCCKYALQSAPKVLSTNERIHVYQCDQSVLPFKRKKTSCTSKESCPAMICATESMKNREIKVEYWNTHFGHSVPAEEDELNAAINSVQSEETEGIGESIHVMQMLNNIGQSIETGAEVFVTDSIDEDTSSSPVPVPRNSRKTTSNSRKKKIKSSSVVSSVNSTPIVQNFSFKKDPSKKKESSIYSLASVACGKISANKINKPLEKPLNILLQTNRVMEKSNKDVSSVYHKVNPDNITGMLGDKISSNSAINKEVSEECIAIDPLPVAGDQMSETNNEAFGNDNSLGGECVAIDSMPTADDFQTIINEGTSGNEVSNGGEFIADDTLTTVNDDKNTIDNESSGRGTVQACIATSPLPLTDENKSKKVPSNKISEDSGNNEISDKGTSKDGQVSDKDSTLPEKNKKIVYNWPVGKPLPTNWVFETETSQVKPVEEPKEKLLGKGKCPPITNNPTTLKPTISSILKNSKSIKSKKSSDKVTITALSNPTPLAPNIVLGGPRLLAPNVPQIILSSVPGTQQNPISVASTSSNRNVSSYFTSMANSFNSTNQSRTPILPVAQTYISLNGKLIPVMNTPATAIPPNMGTNVYLPSALPQSKIGKLPATSLVHSTSVISGSSPAGLLSQYQPSTTGIINKNQSNLGGAFSSLTTNFPGSPVILIPCTNQSTMPIPYTNNSAMSISGINNSAITPLLQSKPSTSISSPLVLQSTRPMISVPIRSTRAKSIVSTSLVQSGVKSFVPKSVAQTASSFLSTGRTISYTTAKSKVMVSSTARKNPISATSSGVKVQKVSLPLATNSQSMTLSSAMTISKPSQSQASSVVLNTTPISSTPSINIPELTGSNVQKPGAFVIESAGELYMLEPLDDDVLIKNNTPLTSTPKKALPPLMKTISPVLKRKRTKIPITPEMVPSKSKKKKDIDINLKTVPKSIPKKGETVATTVEAISSKPTTTDTASSEAPFNSDCDPAYSSDNSVSSSNSDKNSSEANRNNTIVDTKISKSAKDTSDGKTEMVITIASSKTSGLKEVSFVSKNPPYDIKSKATVSVASSSLMKPSPSLITVKTVPSFSIPQSRPITSILNSSRPLLSSTFTSPSTPNYISSMLTSSVITNEKHTPNIDSNEVSEIYTSVPAQNQEVKRGVTIKSVAQEKRCVSDDDLEVMKKVKFYKLEMKYFACQEQCKKLKIELAKALSKNRELLRSMEETQNEKSEKDYVLNDHTNTEEDHTVDTHQEITSNEEKRNTDEEQDKDSVTDIGKNAPQTKNSESNDRSSIQNDEPALNEQIHSPPVEEVPVTQETLSTPEEVPITQENDMETATDLQQDVMDIDKEGENSCPSLDQVDKTVESNNLPEKVEKEESNNTDVYTMVRTSVLRNLYSDVEDLAEEKKQLQKDLENFRRLHTMIVPSLEI